jgi:hypothetical protein
MLSLRKKLAIVLVLILVGTSIAGYFWINRTNKLINAANDVISKAQNYDILHDAISQEKNRCQEFISQQVGEFGNFEYCKAFIDWVNKTIPSNP